MSGPGSNASASDGGVTAGPDVVEGVITGGVERRAEPTVSSRISREPLSVDALLGEVSRASVGGVGLFVGLVRDHDRKTDRTDDHATDDHGEDDGDVTSLDYTAHPTADHELHASAVRAAAAFDVLTVAVEHRVGHLEVGDLAVVVAVGAVHRGPALDACRALIDDLKQTVPIWKEQRFADGAVEWVGL